MSFGLLRARALTRRLPCVLFAMGAISLSAPAFAQSTAGRITRPVVGGVDQQSKPQQLPPAVPGSKPGGAAADPGEHINLDMPPTEALFEAINRGDVAAAKESIGRGADLDGHNVLGMTPLDLSVDLGRNEISFLLLSLRGSDTVSGHQTAAPASTTPARPARASASASAGSPGPREAVVAPAAPRTPQLFAGGGGAPVPKAGFLGFGGGKAP